MVGLRIGAAMFVPFLALVGEVRSAFFQHSLSWERRPVNLEKIGEVAAAAS